MAIAIDLEVRRFLDLEALEHGIKLFSFRVWVRTQFKSPLGWSPVLRAVIDTGAPFSVLPKSLWTHIDSEGGFLTSLRGLVPLRSAVLSAKMAQVTCVVSDLETDSPPLEFWALLADGEVPLVLGCAGFLDRVKLTLDAARGQGRLELASSTHQS